MRKRADMLQHWSRALLFVGVLAWASASGAHTQVTQTYTYDDAGRITSVSDGTTAITYTWDANTNMLTRTVPEPTSGLLTAAALLTLAQLRRLRSQKRLRN